MVISDVTLYMFESEPYGMSIQDVESVIEQRLNDLRTALAKNNINSVVHREDL